METYCCAILVIVGIVCAVYEIYRHMCPIFGFRKWWQGVRENLSFCKKRNDDRGVGNRFCISASFVKESFISLFVIFLACWVFGFVLDLWEIQELTIVLWDKIHTKFVIKYPLLTTIIGAYIALMCDYFVISPKVYVSPNAYYSLESNMKGDVLKFYIENRSLFDCIDIHIDAYKCCCKNKVGDLSLKKIKLSVSDIATMAGRWASNNDKSIIVSTASIKKENVLETDFDYIEMIVKVTHALSRVTKIITQQYYRADIYNGVMEKDKLMSHLDAKMRTEIITLRASVQKRFMYARKFAEYSVFFTFLVILNKMIFETDEMIWFASCANILILTGCILSILFSLLRIIYKIPVSTNENNENYMYRISFDEKE